METSPLGSRKLYVIFYNFLGITIYWCALKLQTHSFIHSVIEIVYTEFCPLSFLLFQTANTCPVDRSSFAVIHQRRCPGGDIQKTVAPLSPSPLSAEVNSELYLGMWQMFVCLLCFRSKWVWCEGRKTKMKRRRAAHSPVKSVGAVIVGTSC